jgi:hypothetical protein
LLKFLKEDDTFDADRFAKAVEYVQQCHRQLEGARRRIAQLQSVGPDGKASTKDWDDTAPVVSENREAPTRRKAT